MEVPRNAQPETRVILEEIILAIQAIGGQDACEK